MVLKTPFHSFLILFAVICSGIATAQSIHYVSDTSSSFYGCVVLRHLDESQLERIHKGAENPKDIFKVFTGKPPAGKSQPAILGTYQLHDNNIIFQPRFHLDSDMYYYASYNREQGVIETFKPTDVISDDSITVAGIYPSGSTIPANILRFYIYFNRPVREEDPYRYIWLINSNGDTVQNAFYPARPALWSRDRQRLTVLLDPGRVKRTLPAHREWGLALVPGQSYQLVISGMLESSAGSKLTIPFIHRLNIIAEDHQSPIFENWQLQTPVVKSTGPLFIIFDEPLDHGQCQRWIKVVNEKEEEIGGTFTLRDYEQAIAFTPTRAWEPGNYRVKIFNNLEDRSGNSIRKTFEASPGLGSLEKSSWVYLTFIL